MDLFNLSVIAGKNLDPSFSGFKLQNLEEIMAENALTLLQ